MLVSQILKKKGRHVHTVSKETKISEISGILSEKCIGAVVVLDKVGTVTGIVSERDVVRGLARRGARVLKETAFNLMTADVIVGKTGSDVNEIMREMSQSRIRHMPIVEKEKLIGLISIGDVVKNRIEELEAEGNMLREYISNG